jgi:hypothetical protein
VEIRKSWIMMHIMNNIGDRRKYKYARKETEEELYKRLISQVIWE